MEAARLSGCFRWLLECYKVEGREVERGKFMDEVVLGDCLELFAKVPDECVRTIHTSPPYNIKRDYEGYDDNVGEKEYLDVIEKVLRECRRTLASGGGLFWQTGYTTETEEYITPLDHLTFDLFEKLGYQLKDRIIWRYWGGMAFKSKFTNKHETILWWVKPGQGKVKPKFDVFPVREATKFHDARNNLFGRNPGNVWEVDRVAFGSNEQTSHIAVFPEEISDRIVLATSDEDDLVVDPFSGSGTVCKVAKARGRHFIGFEISPLYHRESVQRVCLQAKGELLSVLSEIIKEHVFDGGETKGLNAIGEKATGILFPLSLKSYEKIITKQYLDALCAGREGGVKKADKVSLWRDLEEMLPPVVSSTTGKDPVGLISLVDGAYARAYKLHRVYSSAMRFHCAARWVKKLRSALGKNRREGWRNILKCLARSETGSYCLEGDRIRVVRREKKLKYDLVERVLPKDSEREITTPTLFR